MWTALDLLMRLIHFIAPFFWAVSMGAFIGVAGLYFTHHTKDLLNLALWGFNTIIWYGLAFGWTGKGRKKEKRTDEA